MNEGNVYLTTQCFIYGYMTSEILLSDELLHRDICNLLIYGVGVNSLTDILCESDGCYCNLPVSR